MELNTLTHIEMNTSKIADPKISRFYHYHDYDIIILQNVTIGGSWLKGTGALPVLFLTPPD